LRILTDRVVTQALFLRKAATLTHAINLFSMLGVRVVLTLLVSQQTASRGLARVIFACMILDATMTISTYFACTQRNVPVENPNSHYLLPLKVKALHNCLSITPFSIFCSKVSLLFTPTLQWFFGVNPLVITMKNLAFVFLLCAYYASISVSKQNLWNPLQERFCFLTTVATFLMTMNPIRTRKQIGLSVTAVITKNTTHFLEESQVTALSG
jgi:hypothetical protein